MSNILPNTHHIPYTTLRSAGSVCTRIYNFPLNILSSGGVCISSLYSLIVYRLFVYMFLCVFLCVFVHQIISVVICWLYRNNEAVGRSGYTSLIQLCVCVLLVSHFLSFTDQSCCLSLGVKLHLNVDSHTLHNNVLWSVRACVCVL